MKIAFVEGQHEITFRLTAYPPEYDAVLSSLFYAKQPDGAYTKTFELPVAHLDQVKRNYLACAPDMLAQIGGLRPVPWEDALQRVASRLAEHGFSWWLTGSCAACLRGAALAPHDVDIMLDAKDRGAVTDALADWIIEPVIDTRGWVTSHFGVAFPGARVDLAFDPQPALDQPEPGDSGPYARDHLEEIVWRGNQVKVPPLQLQLATNLRRGRTARAEAIARIMTR